MRMLVVLETLLPLEPLRLPPLHLPLGSCWHIVPKSDQQLMALELGWRGTAETADTSCDRLRSVEQLCYCQGEAKYRVEEEEKKTT